YLIASDEELLGVAPPAPPEADAAVVEKVVKEAAALGLEASPEESTPTPEPAPEGGELSGTATAEGDSNAATAVATAPEPPPVETRPAPTPVPTVAPVRFNLEQLHEAIELIRQMDPPGVACRDLRECLLRQLHFHQQQLAQHKNGNGATEEVLNDAIAI